MCSKSVHRVCSLPAMQEAPTCSPARGRTFDHPLTAGVSPRWLRGPVRGLSRYRQERAMDARGGTPPRLRKGGHRGNFQSFVNRNALSAAFSAPLVRRVPVSGGMTTDKLSWLRGNSPTAVRFSRGKSRLHALAQPRKLQRGRSALKRTKKQPRSCSIEGARPFPPQAAPEQQVPQGPSRKKWPNAFV